MSRHYLRFCDLKARGLVNNRTTLARWIRLGLFPRPVQLGPNSIAWPAEEIEAFQQARAAERDCAPRAEIETEPPGEHCATFGGSSG